MNENVLKFCRNFFVDFRVQASFGAFGATTLKMKPCRQSPLVYLHRKFQLCSFYSFGGKVWTTRPSKIEKIRDFAKPEVTSSKLKKSISNFYDYLSVLKIS